MSNWKFKKFEKHIFIHYFITFLVAHSNVNTVISALLCLCSCFHVQVFVVNYLFSGILFLWIEGWVGGVCCMETFLDFYIFFIFTRPPPNHRVLTS